jgi:tRNA pseudouridine55 synthase
MSKENLPDGFILKDKPSGLSSFQIVAKVKKDTGIKKVGHAGTLDPFASGLLIVGIGRNATKRICEFQKLDKEYKATILLGFSTDTDDLTGKSISEKKLLHGKEAENNKKIGNIIKSFVGKQLQIPSTVSAKKIKGIRAYKLHRQGKNVELSPKKIEIYSIDVKKITYRPDGLIEVEIVVCCGTGTYIRALARDIGNKLGVGGHLIKLRRTKIGPYSV